MVLKDKKRELRQRVKETKQKYTLLEKKKLSIPIWEKIEKEDWFKDSKTILLYWSMNDEVYTHDFILKWYKEKTILLPCVDGENLRLRIFEGIESMKEGVMFSILEPIGEEFLDIDNIDLMIIPGVAFDKENNRLGRGKGFYDRLLSVSNSIKVGVCFEFQFFDKVPTEKFDVKMNYVVK
jgi:5-formyltetrahydrofolate cyclo-ligase